MSLNKDNMKTLKKNKENKVSDNIAKTKYIDNNEDFIPKDTRSKLRKFIDFILSADVGQNKVITK